MAGDIRQGARGNPPVGQALCVVRCNGTAAVPDALFGLEYRREGRNSYRFFAVEADRGTMPVVRTSKTGTSVIAKLEPYRAFLAQDGYRRS